MASCQRKLKEKQNLMIRMQKSCSSCVPDNSFKFRCTISSVDLSCAHGGINDVDHHIKTEMHKEYEKNLQSKTFKYLITYV